MIPVRAYLRLLARYLRPLRRRVALLTLLLGAGIACQAINPQLIRAFLDRASSGSALGGLLTLAGGFTALAVGHQVLNVAATYVAEQVGWQATNELRADLAEHVLHLDMGFHKGHTPGELIERIDGDVTTLSEFFASFVIRVLGNLVLVVTVLALLWRESVWVGLTMTGWALLVLAGMLAIQTVAMPWWKAMRARSAEFFGFLGEQLAGTEDVRASGGVPFMMHRFTRVMRAWLPEQVRARMGFAALWGWSIITYLIIGMALIFWLGWQGLQAGTLTIGAVYLVFNYSDMMREPLEQIRQQMEVLQKASAGIARVQELLAVQPRLAETGTAALPAGALPVNLRGVHFAYRDEGSNGETVLEGIDLALAPGRVLGVLGRTGSGKSTLARLLTRLYDPVEGEVLLGGTALAAVSPESRARPGRHGHPGGAVVPGQCARQLDLLRSRHPGRAPVGGALLPGPGRLGGGAALGPRHRAGDGQRRPLRRPGPVAGLRPGVPARPGPGDPGRGLVAPRPGHRGPDRAGGGPPAGRPHRGDHRPPPGHGGASRRHLDPGGRAGGGVGRARRPRCRPGIPLLPAVAHRDGGGAGMTAPPVRPARLGMSLIARQKGRWALNVTIWVVIYVLPIIPGLITQAFFNRVSGATTDGFGVPVLVALVAAYGFGRIAVMFWGMWVDIHFRFRVQTLLRHNLLTRIYERPGAQALVETPGEAMTRFREDVEETDETVSWTVDLVGILFFLPIALGIMGSINARVTAFVFVPMVLVIFLAAQAKDRIRRYRETARAATGQVTGALSEMFGAVPAIKVAGAEASMIAHFRRLNDTRRAALVRDKTLTQILESLFWNSVSIGTGIILVAAAGAMTAGKFTVGDFALFVYFLGFVSECVWVVGMFIARYQQARVSLQRMTTLLAGAPPERLVEARDLQLTGPLPEPAADAGSAEPLRELRVEGLTCHYPGTPAGIEDIDLVLPGGSFTVVTGRIGSGKTTLLRAVLGLLPADAGTVRWNGEVVADPAEFFVPPAPPTRHRCPACSR